MPIVCEVIFIFLLMEQHYDALHWNFIIFVADWEQIWRSIVILSWPGVLPFFMVLIIF